MKKCLIVVDYQVDFVTGTLGFEKAVELEEIISQKIIDYRKNGDEIIFTFDTHKADYAETYEGRHLPVAHCIEETEGTDFTAKFQSFAKIATSVFISPHLVQQSFSSI